MHGTRARSPIQTWLPIAQTQFKRNAPQFSPLISSGTSDEYCACMRLPPLSPRDAAAPAPETAPGREGRILAWIIVGEAPRAPLPIYSAALRLWGMMKVRLAGTGELPGGYRRCHILSP